jgi:hypothetical protein
VGGIARSSPTPTSTLESSQSCIRAAEHHAPLFLARMAFASSNRRMFFSTS